MPRIALVEPDPELAREIEEVLRARGDEVVAFHSGAVGLLRIPEGRFDLVVADVAAQIGAGGVTHEGDIAKVSLVGAGMKTSPGIAARMFRVLADEGINIEMISTSTIRISVVIAAAEMERAVRSLHTAFGLDSGQAYGGPLPERK